LRTEDEAAERGIGKAILAVQVERVMFNREE